MWIWIVTDKDQKTLGDFILEEMHNRDMTARAFSDMVGVSHSLINKFLNHGIRDTYAGKPVGDPSVEFLVKLAKATGTDLATIVALVRPESKADIDVESRLLAQRIAQLPAMTLAACAHTCNTLFAFTVAIPPPLNPEL